MGWGPRVIVGVLLVVALGLQYRLWVGEGSLAEVRHLERQIADQRGELAALRERNEALQAEVKDLRAGLEAIEARARGELGMIRDGETFFQVIEPPGGVARE